MFYREVFRKGMKVFGFTAPVAIAVAVVVKLRPLLLLLLHWDDRIQNKLTFTEEVPIA